MNRKASTLLAALDALPKGSVVVEIGTIRQDHDVPSDGFSTYYLAKRAVERDWEFHSVTNEPENTATARRVIDAGVGLHTADGAEWLGEFTKPINALYLDGAASPEEAMEQYWAANLAPGAIIAIDDVQNIDYEYERGKGTLLLDALAEEGYEVEIKPTEEPDYLMAIATRPAKAEAATKPRAKKRPAKR